jgi:hypothetical protein
MLVLVCSETYILSLCCQFEVELGSLNAIIEQHMSAHTHSQVHASGVHEFRTQVNGWVVYRQRSSGLYWGVLLHAANGLAVSL